MNGLKGIPDSRLKEIADSSVVFDDDIPEFTDEQLAMFKPANLKYYKIVPKKKTICIKLDEDVIDALKKEGKGYQTRINTILRNAVL